MEQILKFDSQFTLFLTSLLPHNQFFNLFFSFFSLRGSSILIWIIIITVLVIFEEKKDKKFIIYFLVTFLVTTFLVNIVLKNVFQRSRPTELSSVKAKLSLATACPTDYSFPSSHAATAFASAAVLSYFDKKRKWFYYFVASTIAYSRIYLYCHYFLDILTGTIIGYFIAKLFLKLGKSYIKSKL